MLNLKRFDLCYILVVKSCLCCSHSITSSSACACLHLIISSSAHVCLHSIISSGACVCSHLIILSSSSNILFCVFLVLLDLCLISVWNWVWLCHIYRSHWSKNLLRFFLSSKYSSESLTLINLSYIIGTSEC